MSNSLRILILAIVMLVSGMASSRVFLTQPAQAQRGREATKSEQRKWEYRFIRGQTREELVDNANALGEQGWEVIVVLPDLEAYLKRPKP